ncbi:MAG: cell wall hydrolase [Clostridia bacterium]|nr:cell wall hydrolase [Clostridia bacterium]
MKSLTSSLRRRLCTVLTLCSLLTVSSIFGASADSGPQFPAGSKETPVLLNGVEVLEGECVRIDGVTYVPLRRFSNLFGECTVTWNQKTNTATVKTKELTLIAHTGNYYIYANGHYFYTVGEVLNLGGYLYVPIRPMALAFAADLEWNGKENQVELTKNRGTGAVAWANYNSNDVYWLSRIISAESAGEPFLGQIAVGNVVLNRVAHPSYPNTIYGVIFDRKHGTQFSPVPLGTIYNTPSESSVIAAKVCLEGYSLSDEILFFFNPRIATSNWISKNRPYAFTIANHDFYK